MAAAVSIARYLFNEASSGTGPTTVIDDTGNGNDLTIDYSGGDASYVNDASGSGIDFSAVPVDGAPAAFAKLSDVSTNGTIGAAFNGVKEASIILVSNTTAAHSFGSRVFQVGTDTGNGQLALTHQETTLALRVGGSTVADTVSLIGNGRTVVAIVIDTAQAVASDRVKIFYNGEAKLVDNISLAQDALIDLDAITNSLTVGNRGDGNRNIQGQIRYFELMTGVLTAQQIADAHTALSANDDANWVAANNPPVASAATYQVNDNAANGTVIGTYTATDSDGTIASYSITGTQLAIDNAGQITLADNAGLTAGTPIVETVTATDDDGETDTATITVNVVTPVLNVTSVSDSTPDVGAQITVNFTDALGAVTAGDFTIVSQAAGEVVIGIPNPTTFILSGQTEPTLPFGADITIPISDGTNTDNVVIQIQPETGYGYTEITAIHADGYYADVPGLAVGMWAYWRVTSGDVLFDPTDGRGASGPAGGTIEIQFYNGEWGDADVITYPSYTAPDTTKPVLTLTGAATINLDVGDPYTEQGATFTDNVDGTGAAVVGGDTVDVDTAGTYTVTYNYTDAAGNVADQITRSVIVTAAPVTVSIPLTVSGVPDGTYKTVLLNASDEVIFANTVTFASGAGTVAGLSLSAGLAVVGFVIDNQSPHVNGAVVTGTTQ